MKNKHLVLMLLSVILLGVVIRSFKFGRTAQLSANLGFEQKENLYKILITNGDTLELTRSNQDWILGYGDETLLLPDSVISNILTTITQIYSTQLLKTTRPDTLGLQANEAISLLVYSNDHPKVAQISFGKTVIASGAPATWVAIGGHEQVYLAKGNLRRPFMINWKALRTEKRFFPDTIGINNVTLIYKKDTLHLDKNTDLILFQKWINSFCSLTENARESDFFEPEHDEDQRIGEVRLLRDSVQSGPAYAIYFVAYPTLPDDPVKLKKYRDYRPQYVIGNARSDNSFFVLSDTLLVNKIMKGETF